MSEENGNSDIKTYQDTSHDMASFISHTEPNLPSLMSLLWDDTSSIDDITVSAQIFHSSALRDDFFAPVDPRDSQCPNNETTLLMLLEDDHLVMAQDKSAHEGEDATISRSVSFNVSRNGRGRKNEYGGTATTEEYIHDKNEPRKMNKPKRPLSAYNLFFQEERKTLLQHMPTRASGKPRRSHGKIGFADLARSIAAKWNLLSNQEKEPFNVMAASDKKRYSKEMHQWKMIQNLNLEQVVPMLEPRSNHARSVGAGLLGKSIDRKGGLVGPSLLYSSEGLSESPVMFQESTIISRSSLQYSKKFGKAQYESSNDKVRQVNTSTETDPGSTSTATRASASDYKQNLNDHLVVAWEVAVKIGDNTLGITGLDGTSGIMDKRRNVTSMRDIASDQRQNEEQVSIMPKRVLNEYDQLQHSIEHFQNSQELLLQNRSSELAMELDNESIDFFLKLFQ